MRSHVLAALAAVVLTVGAAGCETSQAEWKAQRVEGKGQVLRVHRDVSGFTGIHLATAGTLYVTVGKTEGLEIEAEENLIEYIETAVEDGTLKISVRRKFNLKMNKPVKYYVTVKSLDRIALSSSGDAFLPEIENKVFSISLSSSGDLEVKSLATGHLDVMISSSGDASIGMIGAESIDANLSSSGDLSFGGGETADLRLTASSSGDFDGVDLKTERARVILSSSGDAYLWVTDELEANLSSSGSIHYSGDPAVVVSRSSSGEVRRIGD